MKKRLSLPFQKVLLLKWVSSIDSISTNNINFVFLSKCLSFESKSLGQLMDVSEVGRCSTCFLNLISSVVFCMLFVSILLAKSRHNRNTLEVFCILPNIKTQTNLLIIIINKGCSISGRIINIYISKHAENYHNVTIWVITLNLILPIDEGNTNNLMLLWYGVAMLFNIVPKYYGEVVKQCTACCLTKFINEIC